MKTFSAIFLSMAILLGGCSPSGLATRQQVGGISFQPIQGYSVEKDGDTGVFISSPDSEITVYLVYVPNDYFLPEMILNEFGGQYQEEFIPLNVLILLGFGNIELAEITEYESSGHSGYIRAYKATSESGDSIEGEYLFYTVGENTFVAMGSVVHVTGDNQWDPQGKAAFDAIVASVQFP
jgi:hypothetical protein